MTKLVIKANEATLASAFDLKVYPEMQDVASIIINQRIARGIMLQEPVCGRIDATSHRAKSSGENPSGVTTRSKSAAAAAAAASDPGHRGVADDDAIAVAKVVPLKSRFCVLTKDGLVAGVVRWTGHVPGYDTVVGLEMVRSKD